MTPAERELLLTVARLLKANLHKQIDIAHAAGNRKFGERLKDDVLLLEEALSPFQPYLNPPLNEANR